jgi:uncharacterized membrane protein YgdD (TMEM256/DUF423 family)
MTLHPQVRSQLIISATALALAVLLGAFGAHGLKNFVTPDKLATFETGVRYHFYHGFGLLFLALAQQLFTNLRLNISFNSFLIGILLFSFNCYFYSLSGLKIFAMIVPLGGVLFIIGWAAFAWSALKLR